MPQALKLLCPINFWIQEISLFSLLALWGNKKWPPSIKMRQFENFMEQIGLKRLQMVQFECPQALTPLYLIHFCSWKVPFSHY